MKTNRRGTKRIFVAMSGGVDSSVAALLLKREGFDVVGVFMRCYNLDGCSERDAEDARRVASKLEIPFYAWDFEDEYKKRVVEYMVEGYRRGQTPNPDVMCNREIKFGLFLEKALSVGADYVATGHYVCLGVPSARTGVASAPVLRQTQDPELLRGTASARLHLGATSPAAAGHRARRASDSSPQKELLGLFIARDLNKDQSYFLWTLTQKQLKHCLFPIGDYLKSEVRTIAREAGLPTAEKKDSQGICFLGKITLQDFLKQYIPEEQGEVFTVSGQKVGEHSGVHFYTIGQRHGLGISGASPYYIAEKDVRTNTLVVAEGDENPSLYRQEVELRDLNFVRSFTSLIRANSGVRVMARVRYRQPLSRAELSFESAGAGKLIFEKPQKFVAPGQSVVFYLPAEVATKAGSGSGSASAQAAADMEMLGGGVIQ